MAAIHWTLALNVNDPLARLMVTTLYRKIAIQLNVIQIGDQITYFPSQTQLRNGGG
jgi:hypothetical protein